MEQVEPRANYTWRDGHVYSLAWYTDPMAMYYNKKLVIDAGLDPKSRRSPTTRDLKWAAALTKSTNGDGQPDQWFISLPIGEEWWNYEFVHYPFYIAATGTNQLIDPDGTKATFNSPAGLQSYELVNELYRKGYSAEGPFDVDPFLSGIVASTLEGAWMLGTAKSSAPEGFEFIAGPLPKPDDAPHEGNPSYLFVRSLTLMREQQKKGEEERNQSGRVGVHEVPPHTGTDVGHFAVSGDFPPTEDVLTNSLYTETMDSLGPAASWLAEYGQSGFIYDMNTPYESRRWPFCRRPVGNGARQCLAARHAHRGGAASQ